MLKGRWKKKKKEMLDLILEAKRKDPETGSFSEWLAEYLVAHISTIIRPNEPLTLEQLREMDGDPVWFENMSGGRWCIVYADYHCLVGKMFGVTFEEAERTGRVYRRPPEGDEDHHG